MENMQTLRNLLQKLKISHSLSFDEWVTLINGRTPKLSEELFAMARDQRHRYYGHDVYVRGLIEFTNYCKNDCLYCGIRKATEMPTAIV